MAERTIFSLCSVIVDVVVEVPQLPERGGDVLATRTRTVVGGGFNLAAAVARRGGRCRYAGLHGTGPNGTLIREALAGEGVAPVAAPRPDGDSGFCLAFVEPDGERTFVTMPGVEAGLAAADLVPVLPAPGDLVALSGYDLLYPGGATLAGWVGALPDGVVVVLDPGPLVADVPAERLEVVMKRLAVLTLNQREARVLAGAPDATGLALLAALRRRPDVTAGLLTVVREGAAGCVAAGGALGEEPVVVAAPQVVAVDTTGAGDTHTGTLLAELARGTAVSDALRAANAAAADSVTRAGSATAPVAVDLPAG